MVKVGEGAARQAAFYHLNNISRLLRAHRWNRTTRLWGCKWSGSCGRCLRCCTTVIRTDPGTGSSQGTVGQAKVDHTKAGTCLWTHGQQPDLLRARQTGRASRNIPALLAGQQRGAAQDSGWRQLQAVSRQPGSENPSTPRSSVVSCRDSREPSGPWQPRRGGEPQLETLVGWTGVDVAT